MCVCNNTHTHTPNEKHGAQTVCAFGGSGDTVGMAFECAAFRRPNRARMTYLYAPVPPLRLLMLMLLLLQLPHTHLGAYTGVYIFVCKSAQ